MKHGKRRVVAGLALALAVVGCSGGSGTSGGLRAADKPFSPSQVSQAIPSRFSAPKGWSSSDPSTRSDSIAQSECQHRRLSDWSCVGLTAVSFSSMETDESRRSSVDFTLLAYDSVDNAKVGMKMLIEKQLEWLRKHNPKSLNLKIDADEVDASETVGSVSDPQSRYGYVNLRIGTVAASISTEDLPRDKNLQFFAKLQAERIVIAASGKNPDA